METEKILQKYFTPAMLELLAAFSEMDKANEKRTAEMYARIEKWLDNQGINNARQLNILITAACKRLEMWEEVINRKK